MSDEVLTRRSAGILLHPTSLPNGTLGGSAYEFMDFLLRAGCHVWQVLPLAPTDMEGSPYSPVSVFAGNAGLLPQMAGQTVNPADVAEFVERELHWLPDYGLFTILKRHSGNAAWWDWPPDARDRKDAAIAALMKRHVEEIAGVYLDQFRFDDAWRQLRRYANDRGILLYGDLPMFTVADSADVWSNQRLFQLGPDGRSRATAGVPPDAFAEDGQYWGNPLFDWETMQNDGFRWWVERVRHELRRCDLLRLDHFRGLIATWSIPEGAASARDGEWREVPGRQLLTTLKRDLGTLPLVAENLGDITPEVEQLRHEFGLPGMHVFQFAFDGLPDNPHRPAHHEVQGVAYTGTHDNDTTLGWFHALAPEVRHTVLAETGGNENAMPWPAIHSVLQSRARLAVIPMQDYLSLDTSHRMNRPGVAAGNWRWRLKPSDLTARLADRIRASVQAASRS
ncbi:MAG: 4-alpha-glucanotransferase [Woeseiaceae bacterium]